MFQFTHTHNDSHVAILIVLYLNYVALYCLVFCGVMCCAVLSTVICVQKNCEIRHSARLQHPRDNKKACLTWHSTQLPHLRDNQKSCSTSAWHCTRLPYPRDNQTACSPSTQLSAGNRRDPTRWVHSHSSQFLLPAICTANTTLINPSQKCTQASLQVKTLMWFIHHKPHNLCQNALANLPAKVDFKQMKTWDERIVSFLVSWCVFSFAMHYCYKMHSFKTKLQGRNV